MDSICPSALATILNKRKDRYMFDTQIELSFEAACRRLSRRERRLTRAQWWFERMRQVVDRAIDWKSAPQPRPEQMWFPATYRQPEIAHPHPHGTAKADQDANERQICE
jgi:hypothetical protein